MSDPSNPGWTIVPRGSTLPEEGTPSSVKTQGEFEARLEPTPTPK